MNGNVTFTPEQVQELIGGHFPEHVGLFEWQDADHFRIIDGIFRAFDDQGITTQLPGIQISSFVIIPPSKLRNIYQTDGGLAQPITPPAPIEADPQARVPQLCN